MTFFGLWYLRQEFPGVPNLSGPSGAAGGVLMTGVGGTIKSKSKSVENKANIFLWWQTIGWGYHFLLLCFHLDAEFSLTLFKTLLKEWSYCGCCIFDTLMNSVSEHNRGEFSWPLIWVLFSWCSFIVTVIKSPSIVQHMTPRKTILV